jgi:Cys-rich repeat protein
VTTTGGTTSYVPGPPYQGFDAGPRNEPTIQQGCTAAAPFKNPLGMFSYPPCVQCLRSADCQDGLKCSNSNVCVGCRDNSDCSTGQVCQNACYYLEGAPYEFPCFAQCQSDCRNAAADFCNPGICDTDAGLCLPYQCTANSQCVVNGQGACNFGQLATFQGPGGYWICANCTADAGGCGPDGYCTINGSDNYCSPSCLTDAGICYAGTYCGDAGSCVSGCQSSSDCNGSYNGNICSQGQCVACLNDSQCPPNNLGCGQTSYNGVMCGICNSDQNCPTGLHCEYLGNYNGNSCGCHSDDECAYSSVANSVPVCVGLVSDAGPFPGASGKCGCRSDADCGTGELCETRYPYTVSVNNSSGTVTGGTCIASCAVTGGTDCSTAGIRTSQYSNQLDNICNYQTGYCVSCAQDNDCTGGGYASANGPVITPSCVLFANSIDPVSGLPTGGGDCGCTDTSQCNDGYACWDPGLNGVCQPPCTITNGLDSCFPQTYYASTPPPDPFCDTYTGACVQCLDNYGCTNQHVDVINGNYIGFYLPATTCSSTGQCYGCNTAADCPATQPNCTDSYCGFCMSNADCDTSTYNFQCIDFYNYSGNVGGNCLVKCTALGDGTPSDAGNACPPGLPYCAYTYTYTNNGFNSFYICAACRPNNSTDCGSYPNYCMQNGVCGSYY